MPLCSEPPRRDTLLAIGEALIDMIPAETGCDFARVSAFSPRVGGAPANVCAAFARLGGRAALVTQLGDDPFGRKIRDELDACGVDTALIRFTKEANTALAFVSLGADGQRTFSFYRNPSADLLYRPEYLDPGRFRDAFALHFCSVDLAPGPMALAHDRAVDLAGQAGALISFDPNLRPALWPDAEALRDAVRRYLPLAHVVKLSDEELAFLTGETDIAAALPALLQGRTRLVVYTCGGGGAYAFTRRARAYAPSPRVRAVDTTGAGDGFIGSFLYGLCGRGAGPDALDALGEPDLQALLDLSNRFCAYSVQWPGAIDSYPTRQALEG